MKSFLYLLLLLLAAAGGFAGAVFLQSDDFIVSRRAVIDASPATVFEYVSTFKKGNEWSPWLAKDKDVKPEIIGADGSVGSKMKWASAKNDVGEGSQEIVAIVPNQFVGSKLVFVKPFEGTASAEIVLRPVDDGKKTEVIWTMNSKADFKSKAMCLIMGQQKAVAADFDQGLRNLNAKVTAPAAAAPAADAKDTK